MKASADVTKCIRIWREAKACQEGRQHCTANDNAHKKGDRVARRHKKDSRRRHFSCADFQLRGNKVHRGGHMLLSLVQLLSPLLGFLICGWCNSHNSEGVEIGSVDFIERAPAVYYPTVGN